MKLYFINAGDLPRVIQQYFVLVILFLRFQTKLKLFFQSFLEISYLQDSQALSRNLNNKKYLPLLVIQVLDLIHLGNLLYCFSYILFLLKLICTNSYLRMMNHFEVLYSRFTLLNSLKYKRTNHQLKFCKNCRVLKNNLPTMQRLIIQNIIYN